MRVLWLCNLMIDKVAAAQGKAPSPYGGWLNGLCQVLLTEESLELTVCYPHLSKGDMVHGYAEKLQYFGIPLTIDRYDKTVKSICINILQSVKPDVIHIFGTEYPHTLAMLQASEELSLGDKTVVSIQGMVSVYPKHYYLGLPLTLARKQTIRDFLLRTSIAKERQKMLMMGCYEKKALLLAHHVAGRTEWDKACCAEAAPNAQYHVLGELLRDSFYETPQWFYDACEPFTLFVSQASYPVKGFHFVLEALAIIKRNFPDVKVYTTAPVIPKPDTWLARNKIDSYKAHLSSLIQTLGLWDHIVFMGELSEREMKKMYLKCNVFVSASSIENSSNSISEAMLLGVPIVSSCVGGIQSMMEHGVEGFLYQADAPYMLAWYVQKLFSDCAKAQEMGRCASVRAREDHNIDTIKKQTVALYHELSDGEKVSV